MPIKVAINGYGRIGRNVLRALYEYKRTDEIQIVAINDLGDPQTNAHLTKYDTAHGPFDADVSVEGDTMLVNGGPIKVLAERDPSKLPWKDMGIDVVMECTGLFASKDKASAHLEAGARKVLISAPAGKDLPTIVYGVNHDSLSEGDDVVSNASCTTNCLAPLVKPIHDEIGVETGLMTTIHAYTNDQVLTDVYHKDLRRARSATMSQIPTKTGAAAAVGLVLPELDGKLDGFAMRVPTINVSVVDLTFIAGRETSVDEVNETVKKAADGDLEGVLGYNDEPLVSIDFNHESNSSVFDSTQTQVVDGTLVPKDLLRICGEEALQNYLLHEIQQVYRAQNVPINDKHCEIIIRQMLRKVEIVDPGDLPYLQGQIVDSVIIREENQKALADGQRPATYEPKLMGITRAALQSESFISAASFQETTKVLADASLAGRVDNLKGLKENVILGHMVPCGTGFRCYLEASHDKLGEPVISEGDEMEAGAAPQEYISAND